MSTMTEANKAVTEFLVADKAYKVLEKSILSGEFINELPDNKANAIRDWKSRLLTLEDRREDRNARLKRVKLVLRELVLSVSTNKGPDGKATTITVGPFNVSNATLRSFDPVKLFEGCKEHDVYDQLMLLKGFDAKTGQAKNLVQPTWALNYAEILRWLKDNNLQDVITSAYVAEDSTPRVQGPKAVAFLGEEKE